MFMSGSARAALTGSYKTPIISTLDLNRGTVDGRVSVDLALWVRYLGV